MVLVCDCERSDSVVLFSKICWVIVLGIGAILYGIGFLITLPFEALAEIGNEDYR